MTTPILAHAGYSSGAVYYDTADNGQLVRHFLEPSSLTLRFATERRYCTGWHDLETGESHVCPQSATIDRAYSQCPACQKRTGFNPAFYHASSVSEQQQKRNQEPHLLYLAYFAQGVIKVGISHAARGTSRLLEQGAHAAMVLDTYPSALIARQYEASIARQAGIFEHLSTKQKRSYYSEHFDNESATRELTTTADKLAQQLDVTFNDRSIHLLWPDYFFGRQPDLSLVQFADKQHVISGDVIGCIGTDMLTTNSGHTVCLNLKSFVGYPVDISSKREPLELEPVQPSLF